MNELMVHVERVVRPVRAGGRRKLRMREELLAHLTAVYDEERARLGDDALALHQAVRRFGNPAELTRELQATVPAVERVLNAPVIGAGWERRLGHWFLQRPNESVVRHAARLAATVAGFVLIMVSLIPMLRYATGVPWSAVRVDPAVAAVVTVLAFVATLLGIGFFRATTGRLATGVVLQAVVCGASLLAGGPVLLAALGALQPDNPLWWNFLHARDWPPAAALTGLFWLAVCAAALRVAFARERRFAEWKRLEIGQ